MASCPSCGVAVVPGYVKCPKCGNPLPAFARTKSNTFGSGGGTAVSEGSGPGRNVNMFLALGVAVAVALVLVFVLRGSGTAKAKPAQVASGSAVDDDDDSTPTQPAQPAQPDEPTAVPTQPANNGAEAQAAAADLDRELKRQRLWGTVSVIDQRVDVRSGACDDAGMGPLIDAARTRLHGAGLTKLRCLAQSGTVVFERDL